MNRPKPGNSKIESPHSGKEHQSLINRTRLGALLLALFLAANSFGQGTTFTYQGQLVNNGSLADGTFSLQFLLYTNSTGGIAVAGPVTTNSVPVTNGLFTITVDFGGTVWNGATNWLQIGVETNGATSFSSLTPRQQVTPAPCAIFAEGANAAGLIGTVPMSSLSGTYGGALSLTNVGNSFTGNGSGLTNVNAATLGGSPAGNFWQAGGNSGVPTGSNYIGNNDNQYLDIHANGVRVFRLRLLTDGLGLYTNAPNVIGGSSANLAGPNVVGATLAGGGGNETNGTSLFNEVFADFGTVGGGADNRVGSLAGTVSGGFGNVATNLFATVGGGVSNNASGISAFVGGGGWDGINTYAGNTASGDASVVCGGTANTNAGLGSVICGGVGNYIPAGSRYALIGGGLNNKATDHYAAVGGGLGNSAEGTNATVPGGYDNTAQGTCSFAAGNFAIANFNGSFVWADNTGTSLADTGVNQFVARASGGYSFFTGTSSGAKLASGATSWTVLCDRNAKKNFKPVDTEAVLDKLAAVPIEQWNYKWEKDTDTPNIGPMAQDFKNAFYPGRDDKGITTLEFDGVELAAIQGLNQKLQEQQAENAQLKEELNELKAEVKSLEQTKGNKL